MNQWPSWRLTHPDTASYQRLAATVMFDKVETNEGDTKVDTVQDNLSDERADLNGFENCGAYFVLVDNP